MPWRLTNTEDKTWNNACDRSLHNDTTSDIQIGRLLKWLHVEEALADTIDQIDGQCSERNVSQATSIQELQVKLAATSGKPCRLGINATTRCSSQVRRCHVYR
jgi:hypothetical protein